MNRYPVLWQFLAGYLNQDWSDEYPNEWVALDEYLRGDPAAFPAFCLEIQAVLADHSSELEVRDLIFGEMRCAYLAEVDGWTYRAWLQALSDHAARAIGHPRAS